MIEALLALTAALAVFLFTERAWKKLFTRFPAPWEYRAKEFRWQSGGVGLMSWNHSLAVQCNDRGLQIRQQWPSRHRSVLIPWTKLHIARERPADSRSPVPFVTLAVQEIPSASFHFQGPCAAEVLQRLKGTAA